MKKKETLMKIEILGPGCAKCKKLFELTHKVVKEAGIEATIEKIDDFNIIAGYGVFLTPALVVDGQVKSSGKLLKESEILKALR